MDQSSFVDLLQETSADHVGHLEGSANHDFRQIRFPFVCIRVHPWPNCMSGARWVKISEKLLPGHGCTRILLSSYFVDTTLVVEWRHNQRILRSRSSKTAWRTLRATA